MGKHEDRQYQQDIENAVIDYLFEKPGNPIVASPGGTGKTFVMARLIKRFVTQWPGTRLMVLAQDAKLLDQGSNELYRYWPTAPVGIYSAGLKMRDTQQDIVFAGIQSAAKRGEEFGVRHIVFIDEADLVSPKDDALYHKLLKTLKQPNPHLRVVGFTASPYRMGTGCLTNLDLWDDICIDLTRTEKFNWFIEHGFLSPLVNKRGAKEIDITNIAMKGGEFDEKELQAAADTEELNKAVVEESIRYGSNRKHWLVFSSGVNHGHHLSKLFNSRGVPTAMLSGEDSMAHREETEARWKSGEVRCLVNVGLYGRGFDFPAIDMIVWARATQSPALWLQGCVRGTRRAPGKTDALILDMAGNTRRLGPVNDVIVPAPRRKGDAVKGEAPIKECPECHSYIPIQCRSCPDCGYVFPPPSTIKKTASEDAILKDVNALPQIEDFKVLGIRYKSSVSKKGVPYLKVTYSVGTCNFHESKFFESQNVWAKKNLKIWWTFRGGLLPVPDTVAEALERVDSELAVPSIIRVDLATKYKDIVGCDFEDDEREVKPPSSRFSALHSPIEDDDIPF